MKKTIACGKPQLLGARPKQILLIEATKFLKYWDESDKAEFSKCLQENRPFLLKDHPKLERKLIKYFIKIKKCVNLQDLISRMQTLLIRNFEGHLVQEGDTKRSKIKYDLYLKRNKLTARHKKSKNECAYNHRGSEHSKVEKLVEEKTLEHQRPHAEAIQKLSEKYKELETRVDQYVSEHYQEYVSTTITVESGRERVIQARTGIDDPFNDRNSYDQKVYYEESWKPTYTEKSVNIPNPESRETYWKNTLNIRFSDDYQRLLNESKKYELGEEIVAEIKSKVRSEVTKKIEIEIKRLEASLEKELTALQAEEEFQTNEARKTFKKREKEKFSKLLTILAKVPMYLPVYYLIWPETRSTLHNYRSLSSTDLNWSEPVQTKSAISVNDLEQMIKDLNDSDDDDLSKIRAVIEKCSEKVSTTTQQRAWKHIEGYQHLRVIDVYIPKSFKFRANFSHTLYESFPDKKMQDLFNYIILKHYKENPIYMDLLTQTDLARVPLEIEGQSFFQLTSETTIQFQAPVYYLNKPRNRNCLPKRSKPELRAYIIKTTGIKNDVFHKSRTFARVIVKLALQGDWEAFLELTHYYYTEKKIHATKYRHDSKRSKVIKRLHKHTTSTDLEETILHWFKITNLRETW